MYDAAFLTPGFLSSHGRHVIAVDNHYRNPLPRAAIRPARVLPVAKTRDTTGLESSLLSAISKLQESFPEASLHKYRKGKPEDFATAAAAATELERTGTGFGKGVKRLSSLLPGTWRLILTDSNAIEKNAGSITGLGNLPGAKCVNVEVRLATDGKASTVERVKVFGGLINGENVLEGKWRMDQDNLEVTYAKAILMGKATVRADSKAVLKTTYCSQRVRIGRSGSGDFYVFVRE